MQDYLAPSWKSIFEHNGLRDFDDFWTLQAQWFEVPNQRRGGWSGVARCELILPGGGVRRIFLKRQENHVTRNWRHPIRGMATLVREFKNFQRLEQCQVPTASVVYFSQRNSQGRLQAILATEELTGFRSLDELTKQWLVQGWPSLAERRRLIEATAGAIRQMHQARFRHNCLAAKHVFVKLPETPGQSVEVRIIDLEKGRWNPFPTRAARSDLSLLLRHCPAWRATDRVRFYKAYLQLERLRGAKELWQAVAKRNQSKRDRRQKQKRLRSSIAKKVGTAAPASGPVKER